LLLYLWGGFVVAARRNDTGWLNASLSVARHGTTGTLTATGMLLLRLLQMLLLLL